MNAALGSREHDAMMAFFERTHAHLRLDREPRDRQRKGNVYQDGHANEIFKAFREGYEFGKVIAWER